MTAGSGHHSIPPRPNCQPFTGLPDIEALHELRQRPHWLVWDYEWNPIKEKWDKPPKSARTGGAGSSTNRETWCSYDQAADFAARKGLAGVGFALAGDGKHSGIDLDGCRDPETGEFNKWAQAALALRET